jgi:serine/threonine protein phosphatase PrpC
MSRSLGDGLAHACGVSSEASVLEHKRDTAFYDAFLIIASDGVWDFISNSEAIEIVAKHYEEFLAR